MNCFAVKAVELELCHHQYLAAKIGMTQVYEEDGTVVPVTVVQAGPCNVLQVRSVDRDGYSAVQLGFEDKPRRLASRAERGHVAKLDSKRSKKRTEAGVELVEKAGASRSVSFASFAATPIWQSAAR